MKNSKILYLIADFSRGEYAIEEALKGNIDYIQLREKNISSAEYLKRAKRLKEMAKHYNTKLIINDRIDIAQLVEADGVHLGSDDIPINEARQILGKQYIIGATAKTLEYAKIVEEQGADYIGSGAWFTTTTKLDAVEISRNVYDDIVQNTKIPNIAIGGITLENCIEPLEHKASGIAAAAGILGEKNICSVVESFNNILNKY